MTGMAKERPKKAEADQPARKRDTVFISLDSETGAALAAFISDQPVEPDRAAVGLKALRLFLKEQGYLPRPKS